MGPWRDRRFDPATWRPPVARVDRPAHVVEPTGHDRLTAIVIGYVASVLTSFALMLTLLKYGW